MMSTIMIMMTTMTMTMGVMMKTTMLQS